MTRLFCAVLMVFMTAACNSQDIPAKRLIIQLTTTPNPDYEHKLQVAISSILGDKNALTQDSIIQQESRWLIKLPAGLSQERIDAITKRINQLEGVSFAEEDRLMKPLTKPPKAQTQ